MAKSGKSKVVLAKFKQISRTIYSLRKKKVVGSRAGEGKRFVGGWMLLLLLLMVLAISFAANKLKIFKS